MKASFFVLHRSLISSRRTWLSPTPTTSGRSQATWTCFPPSSRMISPLTSASSSTTRLYKFEMTYALMLELRELIMVLRNFGWGIHYDAFSKWNEMANFKIFQKNFKTFRSFCTSKRPEILSYRSNFFKIYFDHWPKDQNFSQFI